MLGGVPLTADRVDRSFLFNIMHTIDPKFFPDAVNEIEMNQIKRGADATEKCIKVDLKMLALLKSYV